jgi:hypothetical protein
LVFPNARIELKTIYEPLTINPAIGEGGVLLDKHFDTSFLATNSRLLISDNAGMGKSTLTKFLCLRLIESTKCIPVLVELRKISQNNSLLKEILRQIQPLDNAFDEELVLKFFEVGLFTVILDGFDEVEREHQQQVISDIKFLVSKASRCEFILTSRPELALSSFGEFRLFTVQPLSKSQAFKIIRNYDSINESSFAESLISEIKQNTSQVNEFLTNPFLVSLLYKSYTFNRDIPTKKSTFYEEVYLCLYKHHDLSKDGFRRQKRSNLDIQDFRIILRYIAFDSAKAGRLTFSDVELAELIRKSKEKSLITYFKEADYIDDLLNTVPIFQKDGTKSKWAHKSIQDYFAAEYIVFHSKKDDIMNKIFQSQKDAYLNIIDVVEELDLKLYRRTILRPVLLAFVEHCKSTYNGFKSMNHQYIEERQSATFGTDVYIFIAKKQTSFMEVADRMEKEVEKLHQPGQVNWSITANEIGNKIIFIMGNNGYILQLVGLFSKKKETIFVDYLRNGKSIDKVPLPENKIIHINDDLHNSLNSIELFQSVTDILRFHPFQGMPISRARRLDIKQVSECLKQIDIEVYRDRHSDELGDI